jgi:hypothetical protein
MPERKVLERARRAKKRGESPSSQAGEFVREEIEHVREGKQGARSPKQAIAIGLSKARRAGVELPPPEPGKTSEKTRRSAARAYERGRGAPARSIASPRRKRASRTALQREGRGGVSRQALSKQAHSAARRRSPQERSAAAKKAVRTKGPARRKAAARRGARTRAREAHES